MVTSEEEIIYFLKRMNNTLDVLLYRVENIERKLSKNDKIILKQRDADLTDKMKEG